jgi:patatin-like phospholipase/acyl hydrolase
VQKRLPVRIDDVLQTKYESGPLKAALNEVFGDERIGSLRQCRIVIPAVDATAGKVVVFKTPHLPNLSRDRHESLVDVLLATTAAPTYFPHAAIGGGGAFLDGGLWANNPSLVAYTEAMKIRAACNREVDPTFTPGDVQILSIGTGQQRYSLTPPGENAGLAWWGPKMFDVISMSQSQGIDCHLKYLIGDRYWRINFDLPDSTWTLDAVQHLGSLIHNGRKVAHEHLAELKAEYFSAKRPDYVPFEDLDESQKELAATAAC